MRMQTNVMIGVGMLALALGVLALAARGCQDPEAMNAIKTLNEDPRLVNRNVHVKKITFTEQHHDAVSEFEADVLDEQGNVVGKASGRRIDGFGTAKPRLEWYDPKLADKSLDPPRGSANQALKNKLMSADANGDGKVTYEEAVVVFPHLMHGAFDYYDRNGDGVISKEDDDYKGPRRPPAMFQKFGGGQRQRRNMVDDQ